MPFPLRNLSRLLTCALLSLVVASCGAPPAKPKGGAYTTPKSGIQQADRYLEDAAGLEAAAQAEKLLAAAKIYAANNRPSKAEKALSQINANLLAPPQLADYSLLYSQLAIAGERYRLAQQLLNAPRLAAAINNLPGQQRQQWHRQSAEVYALLGDEGKSLYHYARTVSLLSDNNAIASIHNKIWQMLSHLSDEEIAINVRQSTDADVRGWYELALATRNTQADIALQVESIRQWQAGHHDHPGARVLPSSLAKAASLDSKPPAKIALLLPSGKEFSLAAETVRDGLMAAYYEVVGKGGTVPELRLYDSDSAPIADLYNQAVAEGAELVIGPLRKDKLAELIALPSLPVPVLGLNAVDDATANKHANLYQFSLAIKDEASQIADRAWVAGYRNVLAITPSTPWGEGALDAFRESWQKKGGKVAAAISYDSNQQDYAQLLEPAFLVRHSKERAQKLRQLLGKNILFTPRRRGDLDMIFLIAYPQNGRQIKPTLDFLYAADLPVLATSHIYDGSNNPGLNSDLDGITFSAMPWTIKAFASGSIRPKASLPGNYRSLFAMGADAYRLHQWLELLKAMPEAEIHGYTGSLSLDSGNRVVRKQPWGVFNNGVAVAAPTLTAP